MPHAFPIKKDAGGAIYMHPLTTGNRYVIWMSCYVYLCIGN